MKPTVLWSITACVTVFCVVLLVMLGKRIVNVEKKSKPLPQGWQIVYQRTNNNLPESIVFLSSNRIELRFAIDYRTNLVSKTRAVRQ